jgi:hypothetical protein
MTVSCSASSYGSGRNKTVLITLNTAVLAPMPRASVITATALKAGFLKSVRKAYRRSWMSMSALPCRLIM